MVDIKQRISDGLAGKFKGLSNGLLRINTFIFGIQRKCILLLGGQSGTFKTTLADFIIINALLDAEKKGIVLNLHYYSFEIDELTKYANWLSNISYLKYGKSISPETIKGLGDFRLTSDEQEIIDDCIIDLDKIWRKIKWTFRPTNPTGVYMDLWKFMESKGTFEHEDYTDSEGKIKKKISKYIPNDPDEYNLVAMDHLFLLRKERGFTPKDVIDKMSEYFVELRNIFGMSFLIIQQFNQSISSVDRQKFKGVNLSPVQGDFRDSTNPYQDADVVLGIMNPAKLDMDECMGYDLKKIDNMIMLKIIKNRLSQDNIAIALQANPKAGNFKELPYPKDIDYKNFVL